MNKTSISPYNISIITLIRFVLICFLMGSFTFNSFSQQQHFCGEYKKPKQADPSKGKVIYDRFGNIYTPEELMPHPGAMKSMACPDQAGYFALTYVGSFTNEEKNTICGAFQYVSNLIQPASGGGNVNIQIIKEDLNSNTILGIGTPYFFNPANCGVSMPSILNKLANGTPNSLFDGTLQINNYFNSQWHTLAEDPCIFNEPDLFSVVLHEIGHILGFQSRMLNDGMPGNGFYSIYDTFLMGKPLANAPAVPLIVHPSSPQCPDDYVFNSTQLPNVSLPDDFYHSCMNGIDLYFSTSNGDIPVSSNEILDPNGISNPPLYIYLSHIDEDCNAGSPYVMHSVLYREEKKRFFHADEIAILVALGYSIPNPGGPPANACDIDLILDQIRFTVYVGETIEVPIELLYFNDNTPQRCIKCGYKF